MVVAWNQKRKAAILKRKNDDEARRPEGINSDVGLLDCDFENLYQHFFLPNVAFKPDAVGVIVVIVGSGSNPQKRARAVANSRTHPAVDEQDRSVISAYHDTLGSRLVAVEVHVSGLVSDHQVIYRM
jgi:hypothetical protein